PRVADEGFALRRGREQGAEGQFRLLQAHVVLPQMLDGAFEGSPRTFMHLEFFQRFLDFRRRSRIPQWPGDVAEVTQRRRLMAFENVGVEVGPVPAPNRLEEIWEVALAA